MTRDTFLGSIQSGVKIFFSYAPCKQLHLIMSLTIVLSCDLTDDYQTAPRIDRTTFIATYVALSITDMEDLDRRDHILDSLSVTPQDLEEFATYHGKDVRFIADLWTEIESAIDNGLKDPTAPR